MAGLETEGQAGVRMSDDQMFGPIRTIEVIATYSRVRTILTHQLRREPTVAELATHLGITPDEVVEISTLSEERSRARS